MPVSGDPVGIPRRQNELRCKIKVRISDSKKPCIKSYFRAELAQIKLEEETRESDLTLLSHLDRKLGSLKQEQTDLIEASYDVKVRKENLEYIIILL